MVAPDRCPDNPTSIAERYLMHLLEPEEEIAFEGHYATCSTCAQVLEAADEYVQAMKVAAERLRTTRK